jgi:hypothetical protein
MYATYFDFKQAAYEPDHSNYRGSMPKKMDMFFYIKYIKEILI